VISAIQEFLGVSYPEFLTKSKRKKLYLARKEAERK